MSNTIEVLVGRLIKFEKDHGKQALKEAIYHGAFSHTGLSINVVYRMCHPDQYMVNIVPERIREYYINAYT